MFLFKPVSFITALVVWFPVPKREGERVLFSSPAFFRIPVGPAEQKTEKKLKKNNVIKNVKKKEKFKDSEKFKSYTSVMTRI